MYIYFINLFFKKNNSKKMQWFSWSDVLNFNSDFAKTNKKMVPDSPIQ